MKKALKNLSKSQQYTINIKFFNIHAFSLKTHLTDISDLEKKMKKELINVNAVYQQLSKIVL